MEENSNKEQRNADDIAIVGMACMFPDAPDLPSFWRNVLSHVDSVGDPIDDWDAQRYLDSGRIYTASGGYLKDLYRFDPKSFGIMPNSIDGGEPDQFLALKVAYEALLDAGYADKGYDHRDTGVVLGHSTYLHRGQVNTIQHHIVLDQTMAMLQEMQPDLSAQQLDDLRDQVKAKLPQFNADVAPSLVPNVMTGRIANRLDLKGPNYLVDAACSSSLLAVGAAIDELRNGRSRMMIAGGVNASMPAEVTVIFSQLGALSKRGKVRPFEGGSDGTLLGEGLGMVVLKRLEDAVEDGDKVYAVIRGVGQASDGRGTGLLAPSMEGELLAMQRAYAQTGVDPASVSLFEAHGTGIPLGDKTEVAALRGLLGDRQRIMGSVALGSVKSMISHCIPAAGIAGLIKTALALHHRVLPPTLCEQVNPELGLAETPLYINTEARPWVGEGPEPCRAGVNSFGFGGINTHAILEEAPPVALRPQLLSQRPAELFVFASDDCAGLVGAITSLATYLDQRGTCPIIDIAATLAAELGQGEHRLAFVAVDYSDLRKKMTQACKRLNDSKEQSWSTRTGMFYCAQATSGKLAFLFPGEGSQYQGMLKDLALHFPVVRQWLDFWNGLYAGAQDVSRTDILFPPASELREDLNALLDERLHHMDVGSEAVFVGAQSVFSLLNMLDIKPDVMMGHSSGESSALAASGALPVESPEQLANFIRELNAVYEDVLAQGKIPTGVLLAVGALNAGEVAAHLGDDVVMAMENCENQLVLFGAEEHIAPVELKLTELGGICMRLPFDRGYHTHWFQQVSEAFHGYYQRCALVQPSVPLYSCASAGLFPAEPDGVRELAAEQWANKVRFRDTVEQMYEDGVRFFVEVGPSGNLSAFVNDILTGRDYVALPTNVRRKNDVQQLMFVVGQMFVHGKVGAIESLFDGWAFDSLDWDKPQPARLGGMPLDNTLPILRWQPGELDAYRVPVVAATPVGDTVAVIANSDHGELDASASQVASDPGEVPAELGAVAPDEAVMQEHFQLMREFLQHQDEVIHHISAISEPQEVTVPVGEEMEFPFLSEIVQHSSDKLVAISRLSVIEDTFLADHILSGQVSESDPDLFGLSCVPLMVSVEIMAEAAAALAGRADVAVIENMRASSWITLDHGEISLDVIAERIDAELPRYLVSLKMGAVTAVCAEFLFDSEFRLPGVAPLTAAQKFRWSGGDIYDIGMFHGPVFQSINDIPACSQDGIAASLSQVSLRGFFVEGSIPALILNPVLLDAIGQVAACWYAQQVGTDFNAFPSTFERLELYQRCPQDVTGLEMIARQVPVIPGETGPEAARHWQFECIDEQGNPLLRLANLANIFFPVPNRFYQARRDPLQGWLGAPLDMQTQDYRLLWQLENFSENFLTQSGGVFMTILAHAMLSLDERAEYYGLDGSMKRRMEWLQGRLSLKEAARFWLYQQTGTLLYPSDIIVDHNAAGAPIVSGWWDGQLATAPEVSLTHNRQCCVAAVSPAGQSIGVDLEQIGRLQSPEHVVASFTEREQLLMREVNDDELQDRILRIWCAKEAAAKFFGLGLQGDPAAFDVFFSDSSWTDASVQYADSEVGVQIILQQNSILAVACLERFVSRQDG